MKKNFLLVAAIASVIGFASCNGDQIEAQQKQIDSLIGVNDMLQKQNASDLETLDQVFQNFADIKKAQLGLSEEASSTEGVTEDQKQKIQENFKLINDKFAENAQKLDSLQNVLNSTKGKISALRGTIAKLQKMQAQSQQEIATLKKQLEDKDIEIAEMKSAHQSQVAMMTAKAEADSAANAVAKYGESNPQYFPMLKDNAIVNAEWELGIPPVPTIRVKSSCRSKRSVNRIFAPWAMAHAARAAKRGVLCSIPCSIFTPSSSFYVLEFSICQVFC